MSRDSQASPPTGFLVRYYVEVLTVLAVLFVLQTGLVPFDYFPGKESVEGSGDFFGARKSSFTFPDVIANTFLYMPIGILFHWSMYRRVRNSFAALLLAIGLGTALSGGIEWMQFHSTARISSVIDLLSNMAGTAMGALISLRCRLLLPLLVQKAASEFRERPHAALVKAYACGLLFVGAMPFSFSVDVNMFKKSLKTVTLVPFHAAMTSDTGDAEEAVTADPRQVALAKWSRLKCLSRWVVELTAFAVLAWLAQPILRGDYRFTQRAANTLVWWYCGTFAIGLSLIQLLLVTRGFDVTDVLFRFLGIASGLTLRLRYAISARKMTAETLTLQRRRLALFGSAATLAYIVYIGLIPLTLDTTEGALRRALASTDFLPFFAYFTTRFDLMMADVMEKFVSYAVLAVLLATCWTRVGRLGVASRAAVLGAVGVAVAMPLEIVQAYIPVRVAGLTDLILAACGCVAGTIAQEKAVGFYDLVTCRRAAEAKRDPRASREPARVPAMTPADQLVASLIDPREDAPAESPSGPSPIDAPSPADNPSKRL